MAKVSNSRTELSRFNVASLAEKAPRFRKI